MTPLLIGIITYMAILTAMTLWAGSAKRFAVFSLADRQVPAAMIFATVVATYIGPGFCMGFIGKGAQSGYLFIIVGLAYVAQTVLVGFFIAPRIRAAENCHTLGEFIGTLYGRGAEIVAGVLSVGLCAGFSAVMIKAGATVISELAGVPPVVGALAVGFTTAAYTAWGGLRTNIVTDAFQFAFFCVILSAAGAYFLIMSWNQAPIFAAQALQMTRSSFASQGPLGIASLLVAFFLGETLIPPYASRILAAKSGSSSKRGFVAAGLFGAAWFAMVVSMGIVLAPQVPAGTAGDSILIVASCNMLSPFFAGMVVAALLAVIMSSLSSLLNSAAVSAVRDFRKKTDTREPSGGLRAARVWTIVIAFFAFLGALSVPALVEGLLWCYAVWAPAILPALVLGVFIRKPNANAGLLSMITGALAAVFWQLWGESRTNVPAIFPALAFSLAAYGCGYSLRRVTGERRGSSHVT